MREIKFRFWDNEKNEFWDEPQTLQHFVFSYGRNYSDNGEHENRIIFAGLYTGIKDKNGKEIYVGDIIYNTSWWWGAGEVFLNTGKCGPCDGDSVMTYACRNSKEVFYNIWNGKDVEVIGNIYENPELLK